MRKSNTNSRPSSKEKKRGRDPVPAQFRNVEEEIEFWENHDLTDYLDYWQEVKNVTVDLKPRPLRLEKTLAQGIASAAQRRGVSPETLANLWLQQKLAENSKRERRRSKIAARATVATR